MPNPYQVLGVSPLAGLEEIKSAYRRLAKAHHPDVGTNDPAALERFHEITAAYDLLRRKAKPAKQSEGRTANGATSRTDKSGQREGTPGTKSKPEAGPSKPKATTQSPNFEEFLAAESANVKSERSENSKPEPDKKHPAFSDFLTNLKNAGKRAFRPTGLDHTYELSIPFLDAVKGTKRRLTLRNNKSLEVHIPPGVEDGQQIRLRGQGGSGLTAAEAGDALVTVSIAPHPVFRRDGADVHIDTAVTLPEAVLGAKINVPTLDGEVALNVPAGSNSGTILRLKGKGLPNPPGKRRLGRGDQYVTLALVLPPKPDTALKDFAATWAAGLDHKPRKS